MSETAFEYYHVQDDVAAKLTTDFSSLNIDVKVLPETPEEFQRGIAKPIVFIAFTGSTTVGGKPNSTNQHSSIEELTISAIIKSRLLYGDDGCHHIAKLVMESITGFQPNNLGRLNPKSYQGGNPVYDSESAVWSWEVEFTSTKLFVQVLDDEIDPDAPILTQLTLNDQIQEV